MTPDQKEAHRRNIRPHAEARVAMLIWGSRYASQSGGSMEFYDSLSKHEKATCRSAVDGILSAIEQNGRAPDEKDTSK